MMDKISSFANSKEIKSIKMQWKFMYLKTTVELPYPGSVAGLLEVKLDVFVTNAKVLLTP